MRSALLCLAAALLGCGGSATRPRAPVSAFSYDVHATGAAETLSLDLCFPGEPPATLVPPSTGVASRLRAARVRGGGALPIHAGAVAVDGIAPGGCASLDLDIRPGGDEPGWPRMAMEIAPGTQMLPTPAWLWRPDAVAPGVRATMHVAPRSGESLALPFPCVAATDGGLDCRLDRTAFVWDGLAAIGQLDRRTFAVGGGVIEVVRPASAAGPPWDDVEAWMRSAGGATSAILGHLPAPHILAILAPNDWHGDEPVDFGYTTRGGGAAILFVMSESATTAQLVPEWVGVHEMSHLAMPVVPDAEAWLSEGFATYEQEVLRVRAGTRRPEDAFYAIADGCGRGDASATGAPLDVASAQMHQTHQYSHVYWGGAALMLALDLALRDVGSSLDERMRHVAELAAPAPVGWNAARVLDALDDGLPQPVAHRLAARHLAAPRCLVDGSFRTLGVSVGADTVVTFSSEPAAVARRAALFAPR